MRRREGEIEREEETTENEREREGEREKRGRKREGRSKICHIFCPSIFLKKNRIVCLF